MQVHRCESYRWIQKGHQDGHMPGLPPTLPVEMGNRRESTGTAAAIEGPKN